MRDIVIAPETIKDIRRLCETYRQSACYCDHLSKRDREHIGCPACVTRRVLDAIGKEEPRAKTTPPTA